jgi:hypothetical protein
MCMALWILQRVTTFGDAVKGITVSSDETTLFERTTGGAGVVTQQWFTGDLVWPTFGNTRIRIYIDGFETPSLDFRLLMASGIGFDHPVVSPWGEELIGATALSGGLYNTLRIAFSNSIRVTATLDEGEESHGFYYIIRGLLNSPIVIGDYQLPPNARLSLQKIENYIAQPLETVTLYNSSLTNNSSAPVVNATGGGCVLLVAIQGRSDNMLYLEGRVRSVIDGAEVVLSSGTEDYFLSAQYFDLGVFYTPLSGVIIITAVSHIFKIMSLSFRLHKCG